MTNDYCQITNDKSPKWPALAAIGQPSNEKQNQSFAVNCQKSRLHAKHLLVAVIASWHSERTLCGTVRALPRSLTAPSISLFCSPYVVLPVLLALCRSPCVLVAWPLLWVGLTPFDVVNPVSLSLCLGPLAVVAGGIDPV